MHMVNTLSTFSIHFFFLPFITDKPKILKSPKPTLLLNETDSVVLTCKASGCPVPLIIWKRKDNDKKLHTGNSFVISKISRRQHGSYLCIAKTMDSEVNATTYIDVQC